MNGEEKVLLLGKDAEKVPEKENKTNRGQIAFSLIVDVSFICFPSPIDPVIFLNLVFNINGIFDNGAACSVSQSRLLHPPFVILGLVIEYGQMVRS